MKVLYGEGKPKLVMDFEDAGETTIILPYCKSLIEKFAPEFIKKELYQGRKSVKKKGFWYYATLDYSDKLKADVIKSFDQATVGGVSLFDAGRTGTMYLYPRADSTVKYEVELTEDSVLQLQQRPFHDGHKGIVLKFEGLERISRVDLRST